MSEILLKCESAQVFGSQDAQAFGREAAQESSANLPSRRVEGGSDRRGIPCGMMKRRRRRRGRRGGGFLMGK
jgi:hypothetical protein